MHDNVKPWTRRARLIAVAVPCTGVLVAACSGGSSASGSTALAYAQCMRTHGIADFPDPDRSGNINLKGLHPGPGSDLDPNNPRFEAAQKACKALQPKSFSPGVGSVSPAQQHHDQAQALKCSRCMRAHGITNFPDPDSSGRIPVRSIGSAGLRPASPQFQTAVKGCGQYQPGNIHFPAGGGS
jgi:hypothetical protein